MRERTSFDPRAQCGQIRGERCAKTGVENLDVAVKTRHRCISLRRQPNDTPGDVGAFWLCRRRQQPLVQMRPGLQQTVADEQHNVRAHARFAGRREHDAGFAQTVEIPQ